MPTKHASRTLALQQAKPESNSETPERPSSDKHLQSGPDHLSDALEAPSTPVSALIEPAAADASTFSSPLARVVTALDGECEEDAAALALKRNRRRKRVRMGEALRKQGIDEYAVAETLAEVVGMLKGKSETNESVEKLLVDVLKECSKHLEEDNKSLGATPVRVNLIHTVARPEYNPVPALPAPPTAQTTSVSDACP